MKLSISNIAWPAEEDESYLSHIKTWGASGVEIAPSRIWPDPVSSSSKERKTFRSFVYSHGMEIPAMQALLYNKQDLGLFRAPGVERETVEYLKALCQLASDIGVSVLVFGSPYNRKRGDISLKEAFEKAADFFSRIAPIAEDSGVCICIEPLRPQETDFITTAEEGLQLVEMVNSQGIGLHLDAKAIAEQGGDYLETFKRVHHRLRHFHINDPGLIEVNSTGSVDHFSIGSALKASGYDRYVSIEMRKLPDYYSVIKKSLKIAKEAYLD